MTIIIITAITAFSYFFISLGQLQINYKLQHEQQKLNITDNVADQQSNSDKQ